MHFRTTMYYALRKTILTAMSKIPLNIPRGTVTALNKAAILKWLIAWKVVARTDQMVTKTFADHRSHELHLDFSQIDGMDLERRLSRLTRWVLEADAARLRFSLKLPDQQVGPDSGELHKHQCRRALAEYQP